jgi:hypothetical protein
VTEFPIGTLVIEMGVKVMPELVYVVVGRMYPMSDGGHGMLRVRDLHGNIYTVTASRYRKLSPLERLAFEAME